MRACWMFMVLLSCRLSHATKSQTICKDTLNILCVTAGDNVSVPCPKLTDEDVTFNLLKEKQVIYNHTCNHDKDGPNCKPPYTRMGVELRENTENKSVSFLLTGVNASSYGIYKCDGIVMYPPPLRNVPSTLSTLVRVKGHQCDFENKENPKTKAGGDQTDEFLWLWILGLVVLSIYSLIVTIIASIIWVKWRRSDSQSDYMNTKPKAPRERRGKRGVQNPIPRRF